MKGIENDKKHNFDLGNVIINYNQKRIINNFTEKEDEIKYIYDEIFHASEWTLMDLDEITNDEAIEAINKRNKFKYAKLTENFLHEWYKKQTRTRGRSFCSYRKYLITFWRTIETKNKGNKEK